MARDNCDGHEGRTRSRGASRGSPECRLKQRWCSETGTGPLVEENRGERERRVPTRAAREFFLSITKRNSPARSPRSSVLVTRFRRADVSSLSPYWPTMRSASVTSTSFLRDLYSRLVGRSDSGGDCGSRCN